MFDKLSCRMCHIFCLISFLYLGLARMLHKYLYTGVVYTMFKTHSNRKSFKKNINKSIRYGIEKKKHSNQYSQIFSLLFSSYLKNECIQYSYSHLYVAGILSPVCAILTKRLKAKAFLFIYFPKMCIPVL